MKKTGIFAIIFIGCIYCGEKTDQQEEMIVSVEESSQLQLEILASHFQDESNYDLVATGFKNSSIASGPPRQMAIYLTELTLTGQDGNGVIQRVPIFKSKSSRGTRLKISSGLTDVSELFTNFSCFTVDGTIIDVPEGKTCECGVYKKDGSLVEKVKNDDGESVCPWNKKFQTAQTSLFMQDSETDQQDESKTFNMDEIIMPSAVFSVPSLTYTEITMTYKTMADIVGCVSGDFIEHSQYPGLHTYCTQYQHRINGETSPLHTDFENKSPSMTKMPLKKSYSKNYSDTSQLSFKIKNPLVLAEGGQADLSIAFDSNRMLRFFNQGRSDQGPNPSFPVNRAYFFTSIFESSIFVFAGRSGKIQGYEWVAEHCSQDSGCSEDDNNKTYVRGWMTVIFDPSGKPYVTNVMPDDDNTLTILKGSNQKAEGIYASLIVPKGNGLYDCSIELDGNIATIYNVNLQASRTSTQQSIFKGLDDREGPITLIRKL